MDTVMGKITRTITKLREDPKMKRISSSSLVKKIHDASPLLTWIEFVTVVMKFIENGIKSTQLKKRETSIKQNNDMNKTNDWMTRIFSCRNFLASPINNGIIRSSSLTLYCNPHF
eukprot:TRINITY_DN7761_c0_g1_i2.p1 TRINITY_DN7761_c0_g1~~TRINITY_DN7761_c0_g1_i2.p1  ORF type:complete len:115 (-),score=14.15 TRINITY_DN7761_c0_g1_i2:249-593(-)